MKFNTKNKTGVIIYQPIDFEVPKPEKLIEELEIELVAKAGGKNDLPLTEATSPDANELSIKHNFATKVSQATLRVKQSYNIITSEISTINIEGEIAEIGKLPKLFEGTLNSKRSQIAAEIKRANERMITLKNSMDNFKRKNRITHESDYPTSRAMTYATFFLLLVLESLMNGYFFASGNEFGLLGGTLQALLVSIVNLFLGFSLGFFCVRQMNHFERWRKYIFGFLAILIIFSVFLFNLLVGHYRTALGADPDNAASLGWTNFQTDMLALGEFDSWMLFGIGCIIATVVAIKSYSVDDHYPGYGSLTRRLNQAKEDVVEIGNEWNLIIDELFEDTNKRLQDLRENADRKVRKINNLQIVLHSQVTILDHYVASLKSSYQVCITHYRQINSQNRTTPPPSYFKETPILEISHGFSPKAIDDKGSELNSRLAVITAEIPKIMEDLSIIFQNQLDGPIES